MEYRKHVFTPHEKKLFLDIVRKYKKIVENRQTDGSTIKGKHAAWDQITCEYNASTMTVAQASSKQLRRLWTNMRQRQRESMVRGRENCTVSRQPSTGKDLVVADITILDTTPNVDVNGTDSVDIKREFCNPTQLSATSLPPPNSSPLPTLPSPPRLTVPPPLNLPPHATLPHIPKAHYTQIRRKSVYGRDKSVESVYLTSREKSLLEREYDYKKKHAYEIHELEMEVLKEKLKEAKANAELAEFYLKAAKKGFHSGATIKVLDWTAILPSTCYGIVSNPAAITVKMFPAWPPLGNSNCPRRAVHCSMLPNTPFINGPIMCPDDR